MELEALNNFVCFAIGVNLLFTLFEGVREKVSQPVTHFYKEVRKDILDMAKDSTSEQGKINNILLMANDIKDSFTEKSESCTDNAKKVAALFTLILSCQLFYSSLTRASSNYYTYFAWIDLLLVAPLPLCFLFNYFHSLRCKKELNELKQKITFYKIVNGHKVDATESIPEENTIKS
ncbi:MAG: hypothetical protein PQ612_07955 [Rickettsiales bacterium]|nr:hypothetical protein [Pseudomonadota bacterium]MDA0967021.1 hypothetical protein [Pseudomonadota bacterium]MDG4543941.1 hypothetical protein [Rickettsiales bacterium]MDG4546087.1 hypothetical protein [Rickettsiales bacterium]MDG4548333.1 hypothetical protein [Rickettsiales bacterium]